jgi:transcriptional regulator with XRE-family HTH domain
MGIPITRPRSALVETKLACFTPDPIGIPIAQAAHKGEISGGMHAQAMSRMSVPRSSVERRGADRARTLRSAIARDVRAAREDAGLSQHRVAAAAGVSQSTVNALERALYDPTTEVMARIAAVLGMDLSVRLYPGTGPLIRDHLQAAMIEALLQTLHDQWRPTPEVAVQRPVRGVIDLVLDRDEPPVVTCEAHSELRRVEQQIRWAGAKSSALAEARHRPTSQLLLLRSTRRTRAVVAEYEGYVRSAYPGQASAAFRALTNGGPWPGPAVLWCRITKGEATIMDRPPRGISVGR